MAAAAAAGSCGPALAEYSTDKEYMPSIADKDYGKSRYLYPDFTLTNSGLQYKDMVQAGAYTRPLLSST
jgi:hypothetical protein